MSSIVKFKQVKQKEKSKKLNILVGVITGIFALIICIVGGVRAAALGDINKKYNDTFEAYKADYAAYEELYDENGNLKVERKQEEELSKEEKQEQISNIEAIKKQGTEVAKRLNEYDSSGMGGDKQKEFDDFMVSKFAQKEFTRNPIEFDKSAVSPSWQFVSVYESDGVLYDTAFVCKDTKTDRVLAQMSGQYSITSNKFENMTFNMTTYGQSAIDTD